jgi:hypothetical protein
MKAVMRGQQEHAGKQRQLGDDQLPIRRMGDGGPFARCREEQQIAQPADEQHAHQHTADHRKAGEHAQQLRERHAVLGLSTPQPGGEEQQRPHPGKAAP